MVERIVFKTLKWLAGSERALSIRQEKIAWFLFLWSMRLLSLTLALLLAFPFSLAYPSLTAIIGVMTLVSLFIGGASGLSSVIYLSVKGSQNTNAIK